MADQRDREAVISIKSNCSQGSPERPTDSSKRRRNTELTNQESGGGGTSMAEIARSSSNASFRKSSWKPPPSKTKSRLIDPVDEPRQKSERTVDSGGLHSDNEPSYEDDLDDIPEEYKGTKCSPVTLLQWVSLVLIIAALGCSLWIPILKRQNLWDLPLWKWEILVLALICGRLVSGWVIRLVVIVLERNFLLRKRVLYFVYGLRRSVQNCLWLGLVLLVWHGIFDKKVQEKTKSRILPYVTKILVCFLVGTLVWLLKTLLVKVLALSFHVNNFFERIQEALFNQYVIETLSGPPISLERHEAREFQSAGAAVPSELRATLLPRNDCPFPSLNRSPTFSRHASERHDKKIPIDYLHKLNPKNISAWNMRRMMRIIRNGSLTTLDERILNSDTDDESSLQIKTVCQAKEAAKKIFSRVAKPRCQCIFLEDLMRFMSKDEAMRTIHLFGAAAEKEGISKATLNDWVVNAFRARRALAFCLNDTKTAVDELHNMLNILVAILIVITSLFILGIPIAHFLVFISSQLLLVVFIFGNSCRTIFEAIIFLFVVHPFDVGDHCEVDGVQMVVDEMNILTTIFVRYDNQKIIYPNSVLATKPIANFYRSPDMGDAIDFCVHISTPMEKIATIKERIKRYIQSRSDHWHPDPMLIMKDVEDLNKLRFSVLLTHRMNHQDIGERRTKRALLVEEMIKVFRELDIEYRMLPLNVNVRSLPSCNADDSPSTSMWAAYFAAEEVMKNAYASGTY
ncbi:Mechanosensitive ion channel protein 8 [Morus notabilis]|uniref:Mechanosensitive ion channel protein n=1 Tax=Morus notabilis TaxID=981085 RepID=W9RF07_9ROSA|nr:mechanosensitive ion channel protein 8 [Morus notabilis]EXB88220.1 Mechanosensitive ion channel protein 8 [Morus notabilis]